MSAIEAISVPTHPVLQSLEPELRLVLDKMRSAATVDLEVLEEALAYVIAVGGKLIRPSLALLTSTMGRPVDEKTISLAASLEMLHTATLVHDDMIDNAALRRGNPTLHKMLDPASAVLLGDLLFAQAAKWAADTGNVRVVQIFAESLMAIVHGELRQRWAQFYVDRAAENYFDRIYGKTAALFAASCETGATLRHAPPHEIRALREYGRLLGLAFQIVDDLLDFVGDASRLGKPVGSDLRNGNITLPVILYLRDYDQSDLADRFFSDHQLTDEQIEQTISSVIASPALHDSQATARRLIDEAKVQLLDLPPSPQIDKLQELADYSVQRDL
ncbi:MAG: polyprenyl synthetase family protein [Anaerolineales bacterium]|nr:polyprenyl synthetase family protein [Anaerolineales bacterium]MCB9128704.1 polyprenyl synthetase family protein [Ardenticatenales bacterium]MCB9172614.1 polyprenyl synthetase family protein [Ardenticatenales bacterium]